MTSDFHQVGEIADPPDWRGALVLARDGEGRVLMQLRDDRAGIAAPGQWCLFGGAVEPGESLQGAARREFHEETGILLATDTLRPLACFASQHIPTGVLYVFLTDRRITPEEVRLGEGAGFGFLTKAQIAQFDVVENIRFLLRWHV